MIVPTLEKQTLGRPYSYLTNFLADTLSHIRVLVVIGTSLRDEHVVGAVGYRLHQMSVLVVSPDADSVSKLLQSEAARIVHSLQATAGDFLTVSVGALGELIQEVVAIDDPGERDAVVAGFVSRERTRIADWKGLTDEQRGMVRDLGSGDVEAQLAALNGLRGVPHREVVEATLSLLGATTPAVRSSAAGSLGLCDWDGAVPQLESLAVGDSDGGVRLEAALALKRIGTISARAALTRFKQARGEEAASLVE
jgi:hypothetical protein